MNGVLLVDKAKGWTSFDVVAKTRSIIRQLTGTKVKVGHTGTLDPLATGLLVILVGSYTKKATELSKLDKVYEVTMKLGETSTTGDDEGEKTQISTHQPTPAEVQKMVEQFIGQIEQTPPVYSAIKVNGQRAYKLARQGKEVKLEPRQVTIYSLKITDYKYPIVKFTTKVSSGTYIRSLVEDIGQKLGAGAYMSDLRRTQVGDFTIKNAVEVENISAEKISNNLIATA
ncbi:MAG TPA: tRNA pseudouridine(55) synthase TruB [Candidatus Saccharimonadales bacterium]|nr:tRNA pseudouridine(55) synthase TruB [Candidatus Saccharimonadales bacterium]